VQHPLAQPGEILPAVVERDQLAVEHEPGREHR
jgi:hypothetical protein